MNMKHIVLAVVVGMATCTAQAEDARGYWNGAIGNSLNVIIHFNNSAEGRWEATMSVPKQNLETGVENLVVTPEQVSFALPRLRASYMARWNAQENAWVGTWTQGKSSPLVLRRVDAQALEALKPKRPQEAAIAARAATYASSEVGFSNPAAKVKLAGTFTVPEGRGPFPGVVLVHGSGSLASVKTAQQENVR